MLLEATPHLPTLRAVLERAQHRSDLGGRWLVQSTVAELDEMYSLVEALMDATRGRKRLEILEALTLHEGRWRQPRRLLLGQRRPCLLGGPARRSLRSCRRMSSRHRRIRCHDLHQPTRSAPLRRSWMAYRSSARRTRMAPAAPCSPAPPLLAGLSPLFQPVAHFASRRDSPHARPTQSGAVRS